jgi:hypothetical protein
VRKNVLVGFVVVEIVALQTKLFCLLLLVQFNRSKF